MLSGRRAPWWKALPPTESSDFDLVNPYNGGSSLAVYGKVDADNFMHLYKTNLDGRTPASWL